jgi:hypothetical protein
MNSPGCRMPSLAMLRAPDSEPVVRLGPRQWNAYAISLLGKFPDPEVSKLTGKTLKAIQMMRHKLGIPQAKVPTLTAVEELQIQHEYANGSSQSALAEKYSVDQSTISRMVNRQFGKQQQGCENLKAQALTALVTVWRASCANGSHKFFGIKTELVGNDYRIDYLITWHDLQAKRRGVLCTVNNWPDLNAIAEAVWDLVVQLRSSQKSFEFLQESA